MPAIGVSGVDVGLVGELCEDMLVKEDGYGYRSRMP